MSLRDKLTRAAITAGTEASARERARCLYVLDKLIESLRQGLDKKLMTSSEKHLAEVKLELAEGIVTHARRGIIMGMAPPVPIRDLVPQRIDDYRILLDQLTEAKTILELLGWAGEQTLTEVREQIRTWNEQEDRIMELEERIERLEEA